MDNRAIWIGTAVLWGRLKRGLLRGNNVFLRESSWYRHHVHISFWLLPEWLPRVPSGWKETQNCSVKATNPDAQNLFYVSCIRRTFNFLSGLRESSFLFLVSFFAKFFLIFLRALFAGSATAWEKNNTKCLAYTFKFKFASKLKLFADGVETNC